MDGVLLAGLALVASGLHPVAPLEVLAVLFVGLVLALRRGARSAALLCTLLFAAGALRAEARLGAVDQEASKIPLAEPGAPRLLTCSGRGSVASSPTKAGEGFRVELEGVSASCARSPRDAPDFDGPFQALPGRIGLHVEDGDLRRGDRLSFLAALAPPQRFVVPELGTFRPQRARSRVLLSGGALDVRVEERARGPLSLIDRARAHVRRRIEATFPSRAAPLARALVLGETDLSAEDDADFRASGLSHLLAVSGMHLVLAVSSIVAALGAVLARVPWLAVRVVPARLAAAVGLPLTWLYADFAGASGSALRAAWMLSAQLLAVALARRTPGPRALGLSLLGMAAVDPLVVHDVSFLLSAAATLGLMGLSRPLASALAVRGPAALRSLGKSVATTLAATLPCTPILIRFAPTAPLGGLLANLVAAPVGELLALPICLAHALLAPFPSAERGAALAGGGALVLVQKIAHAVASVRLAQVPLPRPTGPELAALSCLALVLALGKGRARRAGALGAAGLLLLLELSTRRAGKPEGLLRVTFVDVGQGDAALVDLPSGEAMLIDAGGLVGSPLDPGARVLAPLLRARRRSSLSVVVVSHPHPDHFLGLRAALDGVAVGELWDTGEVGDEDRETSHPLSPFGPSVYRETKALLRARGTRVLSPRELCGARHVGGAIVEVLAPCPGPSEERSTNDNSFVLRIRYGERSVLFVGDAERATESDLLQGARGSLRSDLLKVGHHGSRSSSSPEFLEAVSPSLSVVSCGIRNRYGHPHPITLSSLAAAHIPLLRTDLSGTIVLETDGHRPFMAPRE